MCAKSYPPIKSIVDVGLILLALYLPQSWLFMIDYPWNNYRLSWLAFFPGLPVFAPIAFITHPNDMITISAIWMVTGIWGICIYKFGRKRRVIFWIALAATLIWSSVSAFSAHAVFLF